MSAPNLANEGYSWLPKGLERAIYCGTETWDRDKNYRPGNKEWALYFLTRTDVGLGNYRREQVMNFLLPDIKRVLKHELLAGRRDIVLYSCQ